MTLAHLPLSLLRRLNKLSKPAKGGYVPVGPDGSVRVQLSEGRAFDSREEMERYLNGDKEAGYATD